MNDEPLIRLRPRKSKHGPNENPRKYTGVLRSMLRIVQMSKRGQKIGVSFDKIVSACNFNRIQRCVPQANCDSNRA
jgi:hypothetical protein